MQENKRECGSTLLRVLDILAEVAAATRPLSVAEINNLPNYRRPLLIDFVHSWKLRDIFSDVWVASAIRPGPKLQSLVIGVLSYSQHRA